MFDLLAPPANGFPTEPGDNRQGLDCPRPPRHRQQANKPATIAFIQASHHPVNRAMLLRVFAIGMTVTLLAGTNMNPSNYFLGHLSFLAQWS